jgi:DNA-directed RNA polymerase specialized sigma24 family protein
MATTVANINCAGSGTIHLYHEKVQELTCLIRRSLPYLNRTALRQMGNVADAEDVVQDALLSAYSHVGQFRGQARMSTWLTSIVINSARMKYVGDHGRLAYAWANRLQMLTRSRKSYLTLGPTLKRNVEGRNAQNC